MSDIPPFRAEVFAAADITVVSGTAQGDALAEPAEVFEGDIYQLSTTARPQGLDLDARATPMVVAPGSALGQTGAPVIPAGRLVLMAHDGDIVTLELMRMEHAVYALPLSPMRAGVDYTLVRAGADSGDIRLSDMACASLVRGTRIARPDGTQTPIEALRPGDAVLTRDHGAQPLVWIGRTSQRAQGAFAPVEFAAGVLGNAAPLRISPHHRVFLYQRGDARLAGRAEILVPARALVDGARVRLREGGFVEYFSLVFDAHEIVYAEGIPVESLWASSAMVPRLSPTLAEDLRTRFPGLGQRPHFAAEPVAPEPDLQARFLRGGLAED